MSKPDAVDPLSIFSQPVDVDAFNAAFRSELYGDATMTAEGFAQHVKCHATNLRRSPRWTLGGTLSGVALLSFRGERAWVGGFGVVPEFRRRGLAQGYLEDVLTICRDAGARTLELEVLMRNTPAIALYKRGGFAIVDELVVWARTAVGIGPSRLPAYARDDREIARVARSPSACWQREPQSVAAASPCERLLIGDDAAPRAYAYFVRNVDRARLLDVGARDTASANRLLDALDAVVPDLALTLINEPARGSLHEAFTASTSWTETTRQHRMQRSLVAATRS